jgi:hypothetical protein
MRINGVNLLVNSIGFREESQLIQEPDPGYPSATEEHRAALESFPGEVDWAEFFNPEDFNVNNRVDPDYSKLGLKFANIYRNHYEDEVGRWEDA